MPDLRCYEYPGFEFDVLGLSVSENGKDGHIQNFHLISCLVFCSGISVGSLGQFEGVFDIVENVTSTCVSSQPLSSSYSNRITSGN